MKLVGSKGQSLVQANELVLITFKERVYLVSTFLVQCESISVADWVSNIGYQVTKSVHPQLQCYLILVMNKYNFQKIHM